MLCWYLSLQVRALKEKVFIKQRVESQSIINVNLLRINEQSLAGRLVVNDHVCWFCL